jgi:hypothetical protein
MKLHASAFFVLFLAGLAPAQTPKPAEPVKTTTPVSYVRVKDGGTKLRNLPDVKGEPVLDATSTTLLAVYSERAGWLEVEPASGMKVWVHGSFVKRTTTPGVVEITANNVRMRPMPSSEERSFPLPTKLDKGDRVRLIGRADAKKPVGEDWIQVWSPAGSRAYVAAADTAAVNSGEDVRKAWTTAIASAQASMPVVELGGEAPAKTAAAATAQTASAEPAAAKAEPKASAAYGKLADAEKLLVTARAAENPDFGPSKQAFQAVITEAPQGDAARTAQARLDEIAIREEIQRLKLEKTKYESGRAEKLAEAEAKLRDVNKRQDPLWGRFQARGWLENTGSRETPRYLLRWGGKDIAEIACGSGRYDLTKFVGFEIGILGVTQRAGTPAAEGELGTPALIDATRIEVISAHTTR